MSELAGYGIEKHSIDYVPTSERHGKVWNQGPFWFTPNFHFVAMSIGFIGPSMGLSCLWTSIAGALGIMFGTLFMAFHATQGPELGLPQMIQSRAQFGFRGVVIPLFGTLFNFIGANLVCALLVMSGLHHIFGINETITLGVVGLGTFILAVFGYEWLNKAFITLFWISLPLMTVLTLGVVGGEVPHPAVAASGFSLVPFGVMFATCAAYNIGLAPFISDYTRYLPRDTKPSVLIGNVFFGGSLSAIWLIALGAWLATRLGATDPLFALYASGNTMFHGFGTLLAVDSVVVVFALIAVQNYSGMLTLLTAADSFRSVTPTAAVRIAYISVFSLIWIAATAICGQGALNAMYLVLTIVLYLLVPWTAVNLVDFFFVRKGHYAITEMFKADGLYGAWGWRGLLSYGAGILAIIPFAVVPGVFTGPIAAKLGGVDISWLVGLIVSGLVYRFAGQGILLAHEQAAIRDSEIMLEGGDLSAAE